MRLLLLACAGLVFALTAAPYPAAAAAVLAAINGVALAAMVWDKQQAIRGASRIPESTLHTLCVLGGPGALLARTLVRHKTRKTSFQLSCFAGALVPWVLGLAWSAPALP